jgi:hypothetical protein
MKLQSRLRRKKLILIIGGALVVLGIVAAAYLLVGRIQAPATNTEQVAQPDPKPVKVEANTLFFGNVYWGRYINDWSMASPLKEAYPFSRLKEFKRGQYDAWIAGLECPTVAGFTQTSAQEDSTLSFNCSPDYLPEAAKWFTAFTLANNHTDNRGVAGFEETKEHLAENDIQYFGHPDPDQLDDLCDILSIPVRVTYDDDSVRDHTLPMAFCGYHGVFKIPSQKAIGLLKQYSALMPTIAMPHMGVEYEPVPDQLKTQTYRSMIDSGADFVLGDHPHWIQTTESYKGKLIVYSMGNFIFDQQDTLEVTRSAGIRVVFTVENADTATLQSWLTLGAECATYQDGCLQKAKSEGLSKLPFQYEFGVVGTNDANKIVKPATKAEQAAILQRLDWSHTMNQLQPPQSSL